MSADRVIKCTNEDGVSIVITEQAPEPFLLIDAEGLYDTNNTVYISENSMVDGAIYQGSVAKFRNIILRLVDTGNFPENRGLIDQIFKNAAPGTLEFTEGDAQTRKIDYYVESTTSTGKDPYREHEISLICPDPAFYDLESRKESLAAWVKSFEFEFEPVASGFVFGTREKEQNITIINRHAEDGIGLKITLECSGPVTNPSVTLVETGETIRIGHSGKALAMDAGDVLTITTATGNKHVTLISNGVTQEVNHYLTEDSVFIQLIRGENTIGYDAGSGASNIFVDVEYQLKYSRA